MQSKLFGKNRNPNKKEVAKAMKRKAKERVKRDYGTEQELPLVLVEDILERLGVKSLMRFTSVSKQWNATIKSTSFASRHLILGQSRDPEILIGGKGPEGCLFKAKKTYSYLKILELKSSEYKEIHIIPKPDRPCSITRSCDGLVCVYDTVHSIYVINPATRWSRSLPRAKIQRVNRARLNLDRDCKLGFNQLGLGKDSMTGKYKMVWLYNSVVGLYGNGQTTCEVFDFSTNTWRHVIGSTHRIHPLSPVYLNGSLHWLTRKVNGETKILHFDLHNEVFQVLAETPILHASPDNIVICSLNNHLCVSVKKINIQEIWLLNSYKVWEKTYSIEDLNNKILLPVTLFNKTKTELLLFLCMSSTHYPCLVVHNARSLYHRYPGYFDLDQAISYIPSLISI